MVVIGCPAGMGSRFAQHELSTYRETCDANVKSGVLFPVILLAELDSFNCILGLEKDYYAGDHMHPWGLMTWIGLALRRCA